MSFDVLSATQVSAVTPPHESGDVEIVVTTLGGQASAGTFTYVDSPVVTSVLKAGNPFRLKVLGTNFSPDCTVLIDGVAVPDTKYKKATKLVAKEGAALKAMVPKGQQVRITVADEGAGIVSQPVPYAR